MTVLTDIPATEIPAFGEAAAPEVVVKTTKKRTPKADVVVDEPVVEPVVETPA